MKKCIQCLLVITLLLITQPILAKAAAKVEKPTLTIIDATGDIGKEADAIIIRVDCETKGRIAIYYTTDGKTPTKDIWGGVGAGETIEIKIKDCAKLKVRAYNVDTKVYSETVSGPKLKQINDPTITVEVTDKGKAIVTLHSTTKGVKFRYGNGWFPEKWNKLKVGDKISVDYEASHFICIQAYSGKSISRQVEIDLGPYYEAAYKTKLKKIVKREIKGKTTDEEKLMALWDWTMENTREATLAEQELDLSYSTPMTPFFLGKANYRGFHNLWKDMSRLAGFETDIVKDEKLNSAFCFTKVRGKWFYVNTNHSDIEDRNSRGYSYQDFLDNSKFNFSQNKYGYDLSSERYVLNSKRGLHYFDFLSNKELEEEGYFTYDEKLDQYYFTWYEDLEEED